MRIAKDGRTNLSETPLRKILVGMRSPKLGDFVMMTPALAGLRQAHPEAEITALMWPPSPGPWAACHPFINSVLWDRRRSTDRGPGGTARLIREIRAAHFDAAIDLKDRSRLTYVFWLAGIPIRVGTTTRLNAALLTHNPRQNRDRPDRHEAEYDFDLARQLGASGPPPRMWLPIRDSDEEAADQLLREAGAAPHAPLVLVNPTHGGSSREWPPDRFARLSTAIAAETGAHIVLIGTEADRPTSAVIARSVSPRPIELTGMTPVPVLAAILKRSLLHVSVDTGTMHLAAAMGTPCVAIIPHIEYWERRVRWQPWGTQFRAVGPTGRCPECENRHCKKVSQACVESISVDDVLCSAMDLIGAGRSVS